MQHIRRQLNHIQQEYTELRKILNNQKDESIVAVWGLMNAGKSYLLNMLTQHLENEYFKTNDFRETAEIKTAQFGNITYLDTPGLDASNTDDLEALRGVARADVVLFVHQPQGELEKIEIDFLQQLKNSFGDHAEKNIILVISKVDKTTPENIQLVENKMLAQCNDILGFSPKCFQISNTRFRKGMIEHKNALTKASRINELNDYVHQVASESKGVSKQRIAVKLAELAEESDDVIKRLEQQQNKLIRNLADEFDSFNQTVDDLRDFVTDIQKRYRAI